MFFNELVCSLTYIDDVTNQIIIIFVQSGGIDVGTFNHSRDLQ